MVTNQTYINYIKQIAILFCNNDSICKAGVEARLINNFDNQSIQIFISQLNSRQFYFGDFQLPMAWNPIEKKYITVFRYQNLLTGQSDSNGVMISPNDYNPNQTDWKKVIESLNRPFLRYSHIVGNKIIFASSEHSGYGISFVPVQPSPVQPTGQTGSGTNVNNPGTIQVNTNAGQVSVNPDTGQVTNTNNFKLTDFDLNKLIIPGLIIAGVLIAKQMKLF